MTKSGRNLPGVFALGMEASGIRKSGLKSELTSIDSASDVVPRIMHASCTKSPFQINPRSNWYVGALLLNTSRSSLPKVGYSPRKTTAPERKTDVRARRDGLPQLICWLTRPFSSRCKAYLHTWEESLVRDPRELREAWSRLGEEESHLSRWRP